MFNSYVSLPEAIPFFQTQLVELGYLCCIDIFQGLFHGDFLYFPDGQSTT